MSLKEDNIRFFNRLAGFYDSGILKKWLSGIQKKMLKHLEIKKNSRILDAGCGTGNLLILLSKLDKNLNLKGIDISKEMLKTAGKKLKNKAKLKLMSAEELSYKGKFDFIFSTEAFHHYYNQEKAMQNFSRALKKHGKLVIVDVYFGKILNFIFERIEPGVNKINSKKDFYDLFKKSKFKNIGQRRIGLFAVMTMGEK